MSDKENSSQGGVEAPDGSWFQHVHEDGHLCWRSNLTHECSREIWYTPWESFSSPAHRHLIPSHFAPMTRGSKVPAGSWLQHVRANGHLCWRNNHTGECAREILYVQRGSPSSPCERHLLPAPFTPVFKAPPVQKTKKPAGPKVWHPHPWEEIYHPVDGSKYWRHRETKEVRHKDPLY